MGFGGWINTILSAAISGAAVAGAGSVAGMGQDINWTHLGVASGMGAIVAIVNLFRKSPLDIETNRPRG